MSGEVSAEEVQNQVRRIMEGFQAKYRGRFPERVDQETERRIWENLDWQRMISNDNARNEVMQEALFSAAGLDWNDYRDLPRDGDGYLILPEKEET